MSSTRPAATTSIGPSSRSNLVRGGPQHVYITIGIGVDELRQVHCTRQSCGSMYPV